MPRSTSSSGFSFLQRANNFNEQLLLDNLWSNWPGKRHTKKKRIDGKWLNYTYVSSMSNLSGLFMTSYNMLQRSICVDTHPLYI